MSRRRATGPTLPRFAAEGEAGTCASSPEASHRPVGPPPEPSITHAIGPFLAGVCDTCGDLADDLIEIHQAPVAGLCMCGQCRVPTEEEAQAKRRRKTK